MSERARFVPLPGDLVSVRFLDVSAVHSAVRLFAMAGQAEKRAEVRRLRRRLGVRWFFMPRSWRRFWSKTLILLAAITALDARAVAKIYSDGGLR